MHVSHLEGRTCFVCGSTDDLTEEDIIPRWLLRHLRDIGSGAMMNRSNGTQVAFRHTTVPCCQECNNEALSQVEKRISDAFKGGVGRCRELDPSIWTVWACKVMYGLSLSDTLSAVDRTDPASPPNTDPALLRLLEPLRAQVVAHIRGKAPQAGSVFVFHAQHNQRATNDNSLTIHPRGYWHCGLAMQPSSSRQWIMATQRGSPHHTS